MALPANELKRADCTHTDDLIPFFPSFSQQLLESTLAASGLEVVQTLLFRSACPSDSQQLLELDHP